jgi:hypothetical protein
MALDTMAKNSLYLRVCAPSRTRTCGLLLRRQTPNQARQRPPSPDIALTWHDSRLTTPDAAHTLLTLALSLALSQEIPGPNQVTSTAADTRTSVARMSRRSSVAPIMKVP